MVPCPLIYRSDPLTLGLAASVKTFTSDQFHLCPPSSGGSETGELMDLLHTIVCPGAMYGARHTRGPGPSSCGVQTGSAWGLSGLACPVHAAHSFGALTSELSVKWLPLLSQVWTPSIQNPNSISCSQTLGLNSTHSGFCLESYLCNLRVSVKPPPPILHNPRPPHLL